MAHLERAKVKLLSPLKNHPENWFIVANTLLKFNKKKFVDRYVNYFNHLAKLNGQI